MRDPWWLGLEYALGFLALIATAIVGWPEIKMAARAIGRGIRRLLRGRGPLFVALLLLTSTLSGCVVLDWFTGTGKDGAPGGGGSPAAMVAPWLNTVLPGAGWALTAFAGLWSHVRGRNWRKVAETTFDVIEHGETAWKNIDELKAKLNAVHDREGVLKLARLVVDRYGHA